MKQISEIALSNISLKIRALWNACSWSQLTNNKKIQQVTENKLKKQAQSNCLKKLDTDCNINKSQVAGVSRLFLLFPRSIKYLIK